MVGGLQEDLVVPEAEALAAECVPDSVDEPWMGHEVVERVIDAPRTQEMEHDLVGPRSPCGLDLVQLGLELVEALHERREPRSQVHELVPREDAAEAQEPVPLERLPLLGPQGDGGR